MIHVGDCLEVLKDIADNSIDSIVTDPPYGISFMAKRWDYDVPSVEVWRECMRVLKPGGHMLVACGTRTQHRMVVNIEDAGFEIRDVVTWLYGQGFPKSLDVSKAIDKEAGATREVVGENPNHRSLKPVATMNSAPHSGNGDITAPATDAAKQWDGWGTALKPSAEFWTLARKPLSEPTVAKNVLKWGTGGINVDGCRVETDEKLSFDSRQIGDGNKYNSIAPERMTPGVQNAQGRFPANLILEETLEPVMLLKSGIANEVSSLIREWFNDYSELRDLRKTDEDLPEQSCAQKVLQSQMLLGSSEQKHERGRSFSVREDAFGRDEEEAAESSREARPGQSPVEGLLLLQGIQNDKPSNFASGGAGVVSSNGDDDEQNVNTGTSGCNGSPSEKAATSDRGRTPHQREEGGQSVGEPGIARRKRAQERTLGNIQGASSAPLLVRESDVPLLWRKYFEPSGFEVRARDCAAAMLDKQTGDAVSRFFYQAKASKSDRNKGCEDLIAWESVDQSLLDQTVALSQHLKAIFDATMQQPNDTEWSTSWFGRAFTDLCLKVCKSTTSTETKQTIALTTWSALLHLNTKESILAVIRTSEASGLNLAALAENTNPSVLVTTSDGMVSVLTASHALFNALLQIKEQGKTGNIHSTVKPTSLMAYLCRLITPPGGTVLDPFAGSGSTGVAAIREGFAFVGIEREAEYAEIAKARITSAGEPGPS